MIGVIGDIHGNWKLLEKAITQFTIVNPTREKSILIAAGDFGYWPRFSKWPPLMRKHMPDWLTIYWIDGNHEDFGTLKEKGMFLRPEIPDYGFFLPQYSQHSQIFYIRRGTVLTIEGKTILFFGGADSIDKQYRTPGHDWFPEEVISPIEVEWAINNVKDKDIDIVISHCAPRSVIIENLTPFPDPSRDGLEAILQACSPKAWIFGHYHMNIEGKINEGLPNEMRWIGLLHDGSLAML